jgi:hypothetical protein
MTLTGALVSLALLLPIAEAPQSPPAEATTQRPAYAPTLRYPEAAPPPADAVLRWRGFDFVGPERQWANVHPTVGDWSGVQGRETPVEGAVEWHALFVFFGRIDLLDRVEGDVARPRRGYLVHRQLTDLMDVLGRLQAMVASRTGGQVKLVPHIRIETEQLTFVSPEEVEAFPTSYLLPRVNGGLFDAEDRVYRGPYHSVVSVYPTVAPEWRRPAELMRTPVVPVEYYAIGGEAVPGLADEYLYRAWAASVCQRAIDRGLAPATSEPLPVAPDLREWAGNRWRAIAAFEDPPSAARLAAPATSEIGSFPTVVGRGPAGHATTVELTRDPERGEVLSVVERSSTRVGGFALPVRPDGPLFRISETPVFSFWAKANTAEPAAVRLRFGPEPEAESAWISLGRDVYPPRPDVIEAPFVGDGSWRRIAVDLRPFVGPDRDAVYLVSIEPTPGAREEDRRAVGTVDYLFDAFTAGREDAIEPMRPRTPSFASTDPVERALAAAQATASSPELLKLIRDPHPMVAANAAEAFTRIRDREAEAALLDVAFGIDALAGRRAVAALEHQGTDTAFQGLRRILRAGLTPAARGEAALALGRTADARYRGDFIAMFGQDSWVARVAATEAVAMMPGRESGIILVSVLAQADPHVKLSATRNTNPREEFEMRRVLWSSVNEPSDAVRAWSNIKLIQSTDPKLRAEGYKGVRDESRGARLLLVEWLASNADDAHRPSLELALTDSWAPVRAAALKGLASAAGRLEVATLGPVLDDRAPDVQMALVELALARRLQLPEATLRAMLESPRREVVEAARKLMG